MLAEMININGLKAGKEVGVPPLIGTILYKERYI